MIRRGSITASSIVATAPARHLSGGPQRAGVTAPQRDSYGVGDPQNKDRCGLDMVAGVSVPTLAIIAASPAGDGPCSVYCAGKACGSSGHIHGVIAAQDRDGLCLIVIG